MPSVVVEDLRKAFRRPGEQVHTLKERVLHPLRGRGERRFDALDGVSFSVEPGEFFGIVGRNGSGKSTLLKCLAGIYRADGGRAWITGRLSTFIELGVGFNMDLAARDNIRLNGVMHGLTGREARRREDEVLAFAGLEDFQDLKIKNYSSGMLVRLGFSIMVHIDADVLLIDEVLAVGDAAFQQKCYDQFDRIRDEGRTVLFVTHDMGAVERYCDRALLLDRGRVVATGDPRAVGQEYLRLNFADQAPAVAQAPPVEEQDQDDEDAHRGDGRARIEEAWFEDATGALAGALPTGAPCAFAARVRFVEDVDDPLFGVVVQDGQHRTVLAASTLRTHERPGRFRAGEQVTFRIRFDNVLAGGRYHVTPAVAHAGAGIQWIDRREDLLSVIVTSAHHTDAAVELPYTVELVRQGAGEVAPA